MTDSKGAPDGLGRRGKREGGTDDGGGGSCIARSARASEARRERPGAADRSVGVGVGGPWLRCVRASWVPQPAPQLEHGTYASVLPVSTITSKSCGGVPNSTLTVNTLRMRARGGCGEREGCEARAGGAVAGFINTGPGVLLRRDSRRADPQGDGLMRTRYRGRTRTAARLGTGCLCPRGAFWLCGSGASRSQRGCGGSAAR